MRSRIAIHSYFAEQKEGLGGAYDDGLMKGREERGIEKGGVKDGGASRQRRTGRTHFFTLMAMILIWKLQWVNYPDRKMTG